MYFMENVRVEMAEKVLTFEPKCIMKVVEYFFLYHTVYKEGL